MPLAQPARVSQRLLSPTSSFPPPMTSPAQTPNGGSPLPPIPHGVGNASGTPVMAPTRTAHGKDSGGNSSLGTFGVRAVSSTQLQYTDSDMLCRSSPVSLRCSRFAILDTRTCSVYTRYSFTVQGGVIMDVINAEQVRR